MSVLLLSGGHRETSECTVAFWGGTGDIRRRVSVLLLFWGHQETSECTVAFWGISGDE